MIDIRPAAQEQPDNIVVAMLRGNHERIEARSPIWLCVDDDLFMSRNAQPYETRIILECSSSRYLEEEMRVRCMVPASRGV